MMLAFSEPLKPCANCGRFGGYTRKRGRSKHWVRICNCCDLKYDVRCSKEPIHEQNDPVQS